MPKASVEPDRLVEGPDRAPADSLPDEARGRRVSPRPKAGASPRMALPPGTNRAAGDSSAESAALAAHRGSARITNRTERARVMANDGKGVSLPKDISRPAILGKPPEFPQH